MRGFVFTAMIVALFVLPFTGFAMMPSVGTVTATDPIALAENSSITVWCNATITDTLGFGDVANVNATLWDPADTTEDAADSGTNHYTNASCTLSGGSGTTVDSACAFELQYYANAAEWTCKLTAADTTSLGGSGNVTDVTVNQLKALSTDAAIAFDELALGATSGERSITVTNTGNTQIDVSVDGYGATDGDGKTMSCTSGSITLANLKYNLTALQDFDAAMTALTDIAVTLLDFDLARTVDGTASTKLTFWKLRVPITGAGGLCSGKIVVTAV